MVDHLGPRRPQRRPVGRPGPGAGDAQRRYRVHSAPLLGFLARRLRDPELAADVCAETFAAVLVDVDRFDPGAGTPTAWLYGIARHN